MCELFLCVRHSRCRRHYVSCVFVRECVCASRRKPCEHRISRTNKRNFTPVLVADVLVLTDVLLRFWALGSKVKVTAGGCIAIDGIPSSSILFTSSANQPINQDSLLPASLFILLGSFLLAPQIQHLLTLCASINFIYLLIYNLFKWDKMVHIKMTKTQNQHKCGRPIEIEVNHSTKKPCEDADSHNVRAAVNICV